MHDVHAVRHSVGGALVMGNKRVDEETALYCERGIARKAPKRPESHEYYSYTMYLFSSGQRKPVRWMYERTKSDATYSKWPSRRPTDPCTRWMCDSYTEIGSHRCAPSILGGQVFPLG